MTPATVAYYIRRRAKEIGIAANQLAAATDEILRAIEMRKNPIDAHVLESIEAEVAVAEKQLMRAVDRLGNSVNPREMCAPRVPRR